MYFHIINFKRFFWPSTPSLDIFYLMGLMIFDKKFLDHLPHSSSKRSLWMNTLDLNHDLIFYCSYNPSYMMRLGKFLECLGYIILASVQTLFLLLSMHLQLIYYSGKRVIGKRIELVFPYFVPLLLINQYSVVVAACCAYS